MKQLPNSLKAVIPIVMLILAILACIPPQDCIGVTFGVKGYVVDEAENPIPNAQIRVWNEGSYEKSAFDHYAISSDDGSFSTERVASFACTTFQIEVSAQEYETLALTFYPPANEGLLNELPAILTIQLEKSSEK